MAYSKKELRTVERFEEFVQEHAGEIRGLYHDKYWRNGGWNGLMDSLQEIEKRYKFKYNSDYLPQEEFERIMNEA